MTDGNGAEMFWPILGTAVKVAQSVSAFNRFRARNRRGQKLMNQLGLHRDGAAFGLSEYEVAERRQVWWELVVSTRLCSSNCGCEFRSSLPHREGSSGSELIITDV